MKVPRFDVFTSSLRAFGLVIAGAIIGAAFFMSIYSHNLNLVITENRELLSDNEKLMEETATLRKSKNQQTTINLLNIVSVSTVHPQPPLDKVTESELKRRIHKEFGKIVIGKKISSFVDSKDLYEEFLTDKTFIGVVEKDYVVNIKSMLLVGTELRVWATVKEWKRIPSS